MGSGELLVIRRIHWTLSRYHASQEPLDTLSLFDECFGTIHQGVWMLRQFMDLAARKMEKGNPQV